MIANAISVALGLALLLYSLIKGRQDVRATGVVLFCFAASTIMMVSMAYTGNSGPEDVLWIWAFAGPASVLLLFRVSYKSFLLYFLVIAVVVGAAMLRGVDPSSFFSNSSRNGVSAYAVLSVGLYCLYKKSQTNRTPIVAPFVALLVCLFGEGRSGLVCGVLLCAACLLSYLISDRGMMALRAAVVVMVAAIALYVVLTAFDDLLMVLMNRFEKEGLNSSRPKIWATYLSLVKESPLNVLAGAPMNDSAYLVRWGLNLHNSFFMLHAKFGLFGLLCVVVGLFGCCCRLLRNWDLFSIGVIIVVIVRCSLDWCAFTGTYDVLFLLLIFSTYIKQGAAEKKRVY